MIMMKKRTLPMILTISMVIFFMFSIKVRVFAVDTIDYTITGDGSTFNVNGSGGYTTLTAALATCIDDGSLNIQFGNSAADPLIVSAASTASSAVSTANNLRTATYSGYVNVIGQAFETTALIVPNGQTATFSDLQIINNAGSSFYFTTVFLSGTGSLIINEGTEITSNGSGGCVFIYGTGTLTMVDGILTSTASGQALTLGTGSTANISGGTLESIGSLSTTILVNNSLATLNITGGTFSSAGYRVIYCNNGGIVNMSGGTLTNTNSTGVVVGISGASSGAATFNATGDAIITSASTDTVRLYKSNYLKKLNLFGQIINLDVSSADISVTGETVSDNYRINSSNYSNVLVTAVDLYAEFAGWTSDVDRLNTVGVINGATLSSLTTGGNTDIFLRVLPSQLPSNGHFTDTDLDSDQIGGTITWTRANPSSYIKGYKIYWGSDTTTKLTGFSEPIYTITSPTTASRAVTSDTALPDGADYFLIYSYNAFTESTHCHAIPITDLFTSIPTLTANGGTPTFVHGGSAADLFNSVTATTNDSGQTFKSATITVSNIVDTNEYLTVGSTDIQLTNGNSGTIMSDETTIGSYSVSIAAGTATVTLSGMSLSESDMGTLIDGLGYKNTSAIVTIINRIVTLASITDSGSANNSATISIASTVTIVAPGIIISDTSITEGNAGTVNLSFTITLSTATGSTVTVDYATANGTATVESGDYTSKTGTITFAPGIISQEVLVAVNGDLIDEENESVLLNLSNPNNATIADDQGNGTITDDDDAPGISISSPTATERSSGTTNLVYVVTLSSASEKTITVDYTTEDGTARAVENDYVSSSGILTFTTGQVTKQITIVVNSDTNQEPSETVFVNLSNPTNTTITTAQGTGTITDYVPSSHHGGSTSEPDKVVIVDGEHQDAGTSETETNDGQVTTIIKVDDTKLNEILESTGDKPTVTLPTSTISSTVIGELTGQTVKNMEVKDATLVIETLTASYTLPASQINIDTISTQLGSQVELKDIKVSVKISEPPAETVQIVEDTATENGYQIVVKPVTFEITCSNGNKVVEVSKFNGYVERIVAIPDDVDPSKITTGIVLNSDGTFRHVPTSIIKIDGKYYAKINSLTNSTYSVIWNPVNFADVENHWAKDAVNDMGSRMIVTGIESTTYEPNRSITRAEFAAIAVRALGLAQGTKESSFSDVSRGDWFNGYVDTATAYGFITGYSADTYRPKDTITREQAMAIIARTMKITGMSISITDNEIITILSNYTDGNEVSDFAKEGIAVCLKSGIVTGTNSSTLSPKDYVTRAEVAVMIQKLLQKSGLI